MEILRKFRVLDLFTFNINHAILENPERDKVCPPECLPFQPKGGSVYVYQYEDFQEKKPKMSWRADGYCYGRKTGK